MYKTILVPTDGSERAMYAVEHALDLASKYEATVHSVYAIDVTALPTDTGVLELIDKSESVGQRAVDSVIERAETANIETVDGTVANGPVPQVTLNYTREHDIDLIVMGTHGHTGLRHYLLGSVTEKVVRLAEVPVLTIQSFDTAE
jgi:nucleotide-binding universal stress UspA family protein